eukprot:421613_1
MSTIKADGLIERIDKGLQEYYENCGRNDYMDDEKIGKFKQFAEDNGLDDNAIAEDVQQTQVEDCMVTEFDYNETDDKNMFPLKKQFLDENDKMEEIFRILKHIAINGSYTPTTEAQLTLDTCINVPQDVIQKAVDKYTKQMKCLRVDENEGLRHFFGVTEKCNYPFLTYMVDSYTRDNAKNYHDSGGKNMMSINDWARNNSFMRALKTKDEKLEKTLESSMETYSTRIMQRLELKPSIKIKDDLEHISKYVAAVPGFIDNLLTNEYAIPPFQVDLVIAVKGVELHDVFNDVNDDDDDDDEKLTQNKPILDPKIDHIGNVQEYLKQYPVAYIYKDDHKLGLSVDRIITNKWKDFRNELVGFNNKQKDEKVKIDFNAKTYPQNRRFAIFVDRRQHKNNDEKTEDELDPMMLYLYPNDCNTIVHQHVPEIGFELLQKCIVPRGNVNNVDNITSKTDVCGQILTFMFNVEQKDEMRCYLIWNEQTIRFHGDHILEILPLLFEDSDENKQYKKEPQNLQDMRKSFNEKLKDVKYDLFCKALKSFT